MTDISLPITGAAKAWVALGVTTLGTAVTSTLGILAVTNPTSVAFWILTVVSAVLTPIGAGVGVYRTTNPVVGTQLKQASQLAVVPSAAVPAVVAPSVPTVDATVTFSPVASPTADV